MILIVEGSNKVGKTTFIEKLSKELTDLGYLVKVENRRVAKNKCEVTKDVMAEITFTDFNNALVNEVHHVTEKFVYILDRCYLSEYIYGKMYRGYENESVMKLDTFIADSPFIYQILFISNYSHIKDEEKKAEYKAIQNAFISKRNELKSYYDVCINTNEESVDEHVARFVKFIQMHYGE